VKGNDAMHMVCGETDGSAPIGISAERRIKPTCARAVRLIAGPPVPR
jgi:hypothetical protein